MSEEGKSDSGSSDRQRDLRRDAHRVWQWLRMQCGDTVPAGPVDDPELLLERAHDEMQLLHSRNRQRAVQAITQKNELEQLVAGARQRVVQLRQAVEAATHRGNDPEISRCRLELNQGETSLAEKEALLAEAVVATESIKAAIREEEEHIRRKTVETLSLKAQWKTIQVEESLSRWLEEVNAGQEGLTREERVVRHEQNRQRVGEALQAKNALKLMVTNLTKKVATLQEEVQRARCRGEESLECELLRQMEQYEATLAGTHLALERAEQMVIQLRTLLKDETDSLNGVRARSPSTTGEPIVHFPFSPGEAPRDGSLSNQEIILLLGLASFLVLLLVVLLVMIG